MRENWETGAPNRPAVTTAVGIRTALLVLLVSVGLTAPNETIAQDTERLHQIEEWWPGTYRPNAGGKCGERYITIAYADRTMTMTFHSQDGDRETVYAVQALDGTAARIEGSNGRVWGVQFDDRDRQLVVDDEGTPYYWERCTRGDVVAEAAREPGWHPIAENSDCAVWNGNPQPSETVSWTGSCLDGIAAGDGTLTWRYVWNGEWAESTYTGRMHNGRYHGFGATRSASGEHYEGDWREGVKHGYGVERAANGDSYDGNYRDGKRHGRGRSVQAATGSWYDGEWRNGEKHGQGRVESASGDYLYEGGFQNGSRHGYGIEVEPGSGIRYEGEWQDNIQHGRGVWTYADGDRYEGALEKGRRHGHGTMVYQDGRQYVGEWHENVRHGKGVFTFDDGTVYEGMFAQNEASGRGVLKFSNGSEYVGEFSNSEIEGQGTYRFSDGNECDGEWSEGILVGEGQAWNGDDFGTCRHDGSTISFEY